MCVAALRFPCGTRLVVAKLIVRPPKTAGTEQGAVRGAISGRILAAGNAADGPAKFAGEPKCRGISRCRTHVTVEGPFPPGRGDNKPLALLAIRLEMLPLVEIDAHDGHGMTAHVVAVRSIAGGTGKLDQVLTDDTGTLSNDEGLLGGAQGGQGAGGHLGGLPANSADHGKGAIPVQGNFTAPDRGTNCKPSQAQYDPSQNDRGGRQNGYLKKGHSGDTSMILCAGRGIPEATGSALPGKRQMPILKGMNASLILLWLVSLAQITSGTAIPEGTQIFTVTLKDGQSERVVSAAVKVDDKFVSEFDMAKRPSQVELYHDTPWTLAPPERVLSQKIREIEPESTIKRSQRYKDSGYDQVKTDSGMVWVSGETVKRDARARELQAAFQSDLESRVAAHATQTETQSGSPNRPGFVRLWGRHIVVLVGALVVVVVALKTCF